MGRFLRKAVVEGYQGFAVNRRLKMQCIGKIEAIGIKRDCIRNGIVILDSHRWQAKKRAKPAANLVRTKPISASENPFAFQDHGLRHKDSI